MDLKTAINWKVKDKLFVSLAAKPGKTGETFYSTLFAHHHIDADYIACECTDLAEDIKLVRDHCAGASITMPFKQSVEKHIEMSRSPNSAINTVVNNTGFLTGYNCDYLGLKDILGDSLKDQTVIILGDGAMAENVLLLTQQAKQVIQVSRRKGNWHQRHRACDVLINATSVGMGTDQSPVEEINSRVVIDCVIGNTALSALALKNNLQLVTGSDIYQAQLKYQFRLYTQQDPDPEMVSLVAKRVFD
jgi:shikimate dehydrogenase